MITLSPLKLLIVLVVVLVLLGPDKLPQLARQLGAGWSAFRRFRERVEGEVRDSVPDLPPTHEIVRAVRSPLSFLDNLADLHGEPAVAAETEALDDPPGDPPDAEARATGEDQALEEATTPEDQAVTVGRGQDTGPMVDLPPVSANGDHRFWVPDDPSMN